jgi:hypothetical protein
MMTEKDLDHVYALLCDAVTEQMPGQSSLFLARFALLAMAHINDAPAIVSLIESARLTPADFQKARA